MSMLGFPPITTGNIATTIDTYVSTSPNYGGTCPLGTQWTLPINSASILAYGRGAPQTIAYVRMNSSGAAAMLANPGLVYWVDKNFQSVTGTASESAFGINGVAGYTMLCTGTYPGALTGAALTTLVNGNLIWIVTGGYVPGATSITSVAAGDFLIGGGTSFTPARMTANSAPTNRVIGMATTAISGGVSDVLIGQFGPFTF